MAKLRINEINGKPATSSVWLEGGERLTAGESVEVEDTKPYKALIDRGVLVATRGKAKGAKTTDSDEGQSQAGDRLPD